MRGVENCPEGWPSWAIRHILVHPNHLRILKASNELRCLAPHCNGSVVNPRYIVVAQELDVALEDVAVVGTSQSFIGGNDDDQATLNRALGKQGVIVGRTLAREIAQEATCCCGIRRSGAACILGTAHLARCHHLHCLGDLLGTLNRANPCFELLRIGHSDLRCLLRKFLGNFARG